MMLADLRPRVGLMVRLVAKGTTDFTLTNGRTDKHRNKDLASQLGNNWVVLTTRERVVVDSQTSFPHVRPGASSHRNDILLC